MHKMNRSALPHRRNPAQGLRMLDCRGRIAQRDHCPHRFWRNADYAFLPRAKRPADHLCSAIIRVVFRVAFSAKAFVVIGGFARPLPLPPNSNGTIFSNGTVKNPQIRHTPNYATTHCKKSGLANNSEK
jgi:hypothetical protein